nr:MAG TPA: hypothetical protein [Caudoviricetes sp.]
MLSKASTSLAYSIAATTTSAYTLEYSLAKLSIIFLPLTVPSVPKST